METKELENELKGTTIKWNEDEQTWLVSKHLTSHKPAGSPVWRDSSISVHNHSLIQAIVDLKKAEEEDR